MTVGKRKKRVIWPRQQSHRGLWTSLVTGGGRLGTEEPENGQFSTSAGTVSMQHKAQRFSDRKWFKDVLAPEIPSSVYT